MWNFFSRMRQRRAQRQAAQGFRFTVIAPQTRGQDETMVLRDNIDDLGATAALQQVIEASRPRNGREMSSQTTSLHVRTHVSAVSADSEDYIRNPYSDTGRRPPRQERGPPSSPLAVAPPAQPASSTEDDYVEVDKPNVEEREESQSISRNLIVDPVGTLLHTAAAATLAAGPPGRQYITKYEAIVTVIVIVMIMVGFVQLGTSSVMTALTRRQKPY
ncbi:hypothetical protein INS49_008637 [Diaporthe citri]|uniref:uncharacterized protein n=1 Tax=Diaporthe citri TaxID=83186 RepID=UPI001C81F1B3|nr:uncharacterized protein INS49_008637 [Diaporthe citri]KAG6363536.1 hypothetical protein INS49_008637 [Diaporthe citri]